MEKQIAVSFLEWVQSEGYLKLLEDVGGKWFKVGQSETYTAEELFDKFPKNTLIQIL